MKEKSYICNDNRHWVLPYLLSYIFDESVIAFIPCLEISTVSTVAGISNSLITLYGLLCLRASHKGVEYCLFATGQSRASRRINDSAPHFLFITFPQESGSIYGRQNVA